METLGLALATILTLMVFSYILGDNFLFKLAAHIFVGVAVGYAIIVIVGQVFIPLVLAPLSLENLLVAIPGLILGFLLIFKILPIQSGISNMLGGVSLALVLGVGAALAIGGALFGTLMPQALSTAVISLNPNDYQGNQNGAEVVDWLNNVIILLGTVGTFFYFTFAVRASGPLGGLREAIVRFFAGMGRLMIIFTLGALFANTVSSRVALLISRLQFLGSSLNQLFFGG